MHTARSHKRPAQRYTLTALTALMWWGWASANATPPAPQVSAPSQVSARVSAPPRVSPSPQGGATPQTAPPIEHTQLIERARAASARLANTSARARLTWRPGALSPSLALHLLVPTTGSDPLSRAANFAANYADLWSGISVMPTEVERRGGRIIVRLEGRVGDLPVLNQDARLSVSEDGYVTRLSSGLEGVGEVRRATRDEAECARIALSHLGLSAGVPHVTRRGVVSHAGVATEVVEVEATTAPLAQRLLVRVDAHDGSVLMSHDALRR